MNYILIAILLFFILQRIRPTKGVRQIATAQLKSELKDQQKQFIDVRTPGEFKRNRIQEFKNVPLQQLAGKAEKELKKDQEVIVICQSGMRSQQACKILKKLGFTKVTNVRGGMSSWG